MTSHQKKLTNKILSTQCPCQCQQFCIPRQTKKKNPYPNEAIMEEEEEEEEEEEGG
jgi:hypothetical protein